MDKRTKILILFDIYGILLTEKQKNIMDLYYNNDFSLSEIGENSNTSRQAIHDTVKRCEKLLYEYEEKLQLMKKNFKLQNTKLSIEGNLKKLYDLKEDKVSEIVRNIEIELKEIN
ncbi:putative DNA-binding protein [Hathewaya histolytica]|uniref:UPF0122 protein NCTC503_01516 n=1 Tax=Hathewaya histolytica TaxID=1498 RepID=A0A4U9RE23_HATHI|nr:putative DNA-binding protein [Hathewaya histolytica]VTQ90004.1 putative DNA-binding protein [Hathewaya histolytica]